VYAATLTLARYVFPAMPFIIKVGVLGIEGMIDFVRARRATPALSA
jgi:hypothetical protein